ncbi:MAG: hypothetical protein WCC22_15280 [Terriglobales bacterium]
MNDPEESREEWEKEISDVQHSIAFPEALRSAQIIAKRLSSYPAPIPDFTHLVRLLLSPVLLATGVLVFSSDIPHKTPLGVAALVAGCFLVVSAFRWPSKRG